MILDDLYEAAAFPDRWPAFLERLTRHYGARCACMFAASEWHSVFEMSEGNDGFFQRYIDGGWMADNERVAPLVRDHAPRFVTDGDLRSPDEMAAMPVYRDFLIPTGYAIGAGTLIQGVSDKRVVLTLEGFADDAAVRAALPSLDRLRPHLARAASLSAQIAEAAARAMTHTLALAGTAAAVIGGDGRLRAWNRPFETSLGDRVTTVRGRVHFHRQHVNDRLAAALRIHASGAVAASTIVVDAHDDLPTCVLHLVPLRRQARSFFDSDGFVMLVADPSNRNTPDAALLKLLFDLTPAEAMLVAELANGRSLHDAAAARGITYSTARTQLRAVFAKTGCRRQGELVALLNAPTLKTGQSKG